MTRPTLDARAGLLRAPSRLDPAAIRAAVHRRMLDGLSMVQLFLALESAWLASRLWLPGDTFALPGYAWFHDRMPEWMWATLLTAEALFAAVGVLLPRAWRRTRIASAAACGSMLGLIAYGFWVGGQPGGWAWGTYGVLAAEAWWMLWRRLQPDRDG